MHWTSLHQYHETEHTTLRLHRRRLHRHWRSLLLIREYQANLFWSDPKTRVLLFRMLQYVYKYYVEGASPKSQIFDLIIKLS